MSARLEQVWKRGAIAFWLPDILKGPPTKEMREAYLKLYDLTTPERLAMEPKPPSHCGSNPSPGWPDPIEALAQSER